MASEPTTTNGASPVKARVFISYSRKDSAFADRLVAALTARCFEPLIDRAEIYAFEDWWNRIEKLITYADAVVFVLSPDSVSSDIALEEVAFAASLNKRFAPIVCRRVESNTVPQALARLNFVQFDDEARFDESADRLAEALATDIDWVRQHTAFGEAARRWLLAKSPAGLLLRSPTLDEAERWIASRPLSGPEPTEETRAFVIESRRGTTRRRNIVTASLAVGMGIALVLAGLAGWQWRRAEEQKRIAESQRDRAEKTLALAADTTNKLIFDLASDFRDLMGVPIEAVHKVLDAALALQSQLESWGETEPMLRYNLAMALGEIATTLSDRGDLDRAETAAARQVELFRELSGREPSNLKWQAGLGLAYKTLGDAYLKQSKNELALATFQLGLPIAERLVIADTSNKVWKRLLEALHGRIGDALLFMGRREQAEVSIRSAIVIAEELIAADPFDLNFQDDLALVYGKLATVFLDAGNYEDALTWYNKSLSILEKFAALQSNDANWQFNLLRTYDIVGVVLAAVGRNVEAIASLRKALDVAERLADQGNIRLQGYLARILYQLAVLGDEPFSRLSRALSILRRLESEGRLSEQDRLQLARIEKLTSDLGK